MYKQTKRRKTENSTVKIETTPTVKTKKSSKSLPAPSQLPQNINQLPVDILYEIFQRLSFSDRQTAGLVCKSWFQVSKHHTFLKNCVVKIHNRQFCEERIAKNGVVPCTMELFAKTKRNFQNFEFRRIDLNQKISQKSFTKGMANSIRRLTIHKCKVKLPILDAMLTSSPSLRSLEFNELDRSTTMQWEWVMSQTDHVPPVTEVTHIKWHDSEAFISTDIFDYLLTVCPKLESIDLAAGLQHFCSQACLALHMNSEASRAAVKESQFVNFLEKFAPQLKAIAIDELNKPYPYIESLVQFSEAMQLDELRLKHSQVVVDDLNEILKAQKALKVLHLRYLDMNAETMRIIAGMTELQELKLESNSVEISDDDIKPIRVLSKLKSLELHRLSSLTDVGFKEILVESGFVNIEALTFVSLSNNITTDVFVQSIAKFNHLKELRLVHCSRFITNDIMQTIFEHLVNLEELECEDATKVSNIGFLGRSRTTAFQITRLTNLRRVSFSGMTRLNDRMLKTITNNTLQYLDISSSRCITTEGVKALLHQLPSLEVLKLNGNPQISTRIMNYAVNQDCAPRLKDILMKCKFEHCLL